MGINYRVKGMKRPGETVEWTEERVQEFTKCATDVFYFAENYYTIVEENGGKHVIKLFDYQKEIVQSYVDNKFNIVLCGRQLGKCIYSTQFVEILDTTTNTVEKISIKEFFEKIK